MEQEKKNFNDSLKSLNEDNEELQQKNKMWVKKLDEEIEKNAVSMSELTNKIKEL